MKINLAWVREAWPAIAREGDAAYVEVDGVEVPEFAVLEYLEARDDYVRMALQLAGWHEGGVPLDAGCNFEDPDVDRELA